MESYERYFMLFFSLLGPRPKRIKRYTHLAHNEYDDIISFSECYQRYNVLYLWIRSSKTVEFIRTVISMVYARAGTTGVSVHDDRRVGANVGK